MSMDCTQTINELADFSAERDDGNIVIVTINQTARKMNVIDDTFNHSFAVLVDAFTNDETAKGLILTSGKESFIVGADIDQLASIQTHEQAFKLVESLKASLRKLEKSGKPVVAAMTGSALGGGLEVALGCHYRLAIDSARTKIGLPEVKLGLLPGGGGTQRLMRLLGMQKSLEMMTQGKIVSAIAAKEIGFIDAIASDKDDMLNKAKAWIKANPDAQQPWDKKGFSIPGGNANHPKNAQMLSVAPAMAYQKSHGNYPAIIHIMSCVFEGSLLDIDAALEVESSYFAACVLSPESNNLITSMWTQLNQIKKGQSRPNGFDRQKVNKVAVLGAGMMGAGIAYVAAKAGINVVLLDTSIENANRGKQYSEKLLDKAINRGRSNDTKKEALLSKIQTTTSYDDIASCDLVIEAVFENRDIKAKCTEQAEAVIAETVVYASNTSTIPITSLATASKRPSQFIGLHFFSPVDKMPLVEIIMGAQTDDETLAKAFDFVLQIGKTPIVVNDSRGFYTSRVFGTYVSEGIAMLGEGVHPRRIEVAGLKAGMPMPPLALQDEVSLDLSMHIMEQSKKDTLSEGKEWVSHPSAAVLNVIAKDHERLGKKVDKGFYDYSQNDEGKGDKRLWPKLTELFPPIDEQPDMQELIDRLLYIQANESARCYEENVLRAVAEGNVGSIFGWGFAPHQGGTLQFINATGVEKFVKRSHELAAKFGTRFEPAQILIEMAKKGEVFSDD
ncbi:3-hydroxyacyl-CoA dehydrogenase NAD-binding domain-containing protein [Psychrobacter sp. P2G3]|uniref:3-hydroxyacyl-CoA dehydrogenase NAD-binding domain-containing protein n=1 Tax=Psychrobacter sp. P2G3 TaxID=1699622 RepID=UPI00078B7D7F|nr:3-hydroxyacyl-CoA dehydrogenase NAD-binding domain-containing protein [Psychrobacter sp. P2G3]AMN49616.1 3-hydroxyacyl-CoA dehydrogenase [Psychrobacter sp. P2G3]